MLKILISAVASSFYADSTSIQLKEKERKRSISSISSSVRVSEMLVNYPQGILKTQVPNLFNYSDIHSLN